MNHNGYRFSLLQLLAAVAFAGLATILPGCGTVQEGTETEEDWANTPPISVTARLEYRVDSLTHENRKLQQQLESSTTESRNLAARNAELDARVREAATMPRQMEVSAPAATQGTTPAAQSGGGYEGALEKYRAKNFQEAIDQFNILISGNIRADLLDNCHYWIGESYFGMKKYSEAIQQFETVVGIAGSDKRDDAQYMIGNSYLQMGNKEEARNAFQKLVTTFPSSPLAKRAKSKMSSL